MLEKEFRSVNGLESKEGSRTITGYAIVVNSPSQDIGFREYIHPEALTDELIKESDIFALLNQDEHDVLARCKNGVGNLKLTIDARGLKYEFDALNNELGDRVLSYVQSGIIDGSSFAFTVADDGQKWTRNADGSIQRDIYKFERIYDISPVYVPAYAASSCSCRAFDEFKKAEEKRNAERKAEYDEYRQKINSL